MPKLDGTHIVERLQKRLAELIDGDEVAAKDIRALLTEEQQQALADAWAAQEELRKQKRARTEQEQIALGWKTKRDVRIEAFKAALETAKLKEVAAWEKKLHDAEVRGARIYFDAFNSARNDGKDKQVAENFANNGLTRAGLRRMDGSAVAQANQRDKQIWDMEKALRTRFEGEMAAHELEEQRLLAKHDEAAKKAGKRRI